jgi:hypothetical protein
MGAFAIAEQLLRAAKELHQAFFSELSPVLVGHIDLLRRYKATLDVESRSVPY